MASTSRSARVRAALLVAAALVALAAGPSQASASRGGPKQTKKDGLVWLLKTECSAFLADGSCSLGTVPEADVNDVPCAVPTDEPELMVDPCGCPSKAMNSKPGAVQCEKLLDQLKVSDACRPVCRADGANWAAAGCTVPNDQSVRSCQVACCREQRCENFWASGTPCVGRPPAATNSTVCGPDAVCKKRCCGAGDRADSNAQALEQLDEIAMDRLAALLRDLERAPRPASRVILALSEPEEDGFGVAYKIVSGTQAALVAACRRHRVRVAAGRLEVLSLEGGGAGEPPSEVEARGGEPARSPNVAVARQLNPVAADRVIELLDELRGLKPPVEVRLTGVPTRNGFVVQFTAAAAAARVLSSAAQTRGIKYQASAPANGQVKGTLTVAAVSVAEVLVDPATRGVVAMA